MKQKLLVSQIQNFSLHDGPGIRTTVFLQGCNLRCKWCHNPETWKKESILSYTENKCIGCGQCIEICPSGAQQIQNGQHIYERTLCTVCGKCVEICCTEALEIVGSYYSAEELSELLLRDRRLYEISEGGVTFSGGEPMMQAEILYDLCNRLQKEHISVAFETALAFPWKVIHRMTECADLFLVDFKMFDNEKHKEYTGTENTLIKENLKKLVNYRPIMIRLPIIKGINDEIENAVATADFFAALVLMEIPCAEKQPVQFAGGEFIRIGTNKKNLKEYPDKERELWRTFDSTPYELRIAMGNLDEDEMVLLLDYSKYYDKLEMPIPRNRDKVLEDLQHEKFIKRNDAGTWDITNMGALMIAKDLKKFESLHRRTVRVIWYKENSRLDAIREKEFCAGYAFSHEEIVQYIMTIIPQEEVIVEATRKSVVSFPEIAIRELLANAMIHQDLQQRGTNPMVEVFKNRIEFSNAGAPLVAIERIVDSVPVSRNENIAGFMHKCGICEERGSGYDKIVEATGKNELLAPRIENQNNQFTKAILFAKVPFELTTKEDRMRTCYMQACLAYVNFEGISNSDIRKIFGLGEKEKAKASRLLTSAVDGGYIKVMDPDTAPRYKKYIPYWA